MDFHEIKSLLDELKQDGLRVSTDGVKLVVRKHEGHTDIPPEQLSRLKANKQLIIQFLQSEASIYDDTGVLEPVSRNKSHYPLSFAQQRMWLHELKTGPSEEYVITASFEVHGNLNVEVLKGALSAIIQRHEILRTKYEVVDDAPMQHVMEWSPELLKFTHHEFICEGDTLEAIQPLLAQENNQPFDLSQDGMLRASLKLCLHLLCITLLATAGH